ncbi:Gfo/Idh/MocA family protein [Membranihabitans marinus]|uniref:Gfo/Idh/MocA family protein n=1 Tax=Membranihabitans marinus TaxID=1227546 RepID=UPI001F3E4312|nr:Gfo/Idh/MocA family oxidoreductase [Membranihabitans marinus]
MEKFDENLWKGQSRRSFLKTTAATLATTSVGLGTAYSMVPNMTSKNSILKVGLIGCGGRGTGAAVQALNADPDVEITAMGDIFEDRLLKSYNALIEEYPERVKVDSSRQFLGFDSYQKVIDSGVDVVLLAAPPYARPHHLAAAVKAGKHVFAEKPVAVDAPGVRSIIDSAKIAKEKNLSLVSGFCFRHNTPNQAAFGRILDGQCGDIRSVSTYRYGGELWSFPRKPEWTDMEYMLRNWYYYDWMSGDFIVEVAVHSLDMMAWALGDRVPVKAIGIGGRQKRVDPIFGNIYDHFAIEYEYEDDVKGYHFTRQHTGCPSRNTVEVFGSDGYAYLQMYKEWRITGKNPWSYEGEMNVMHQAEQDALFAAIRKNEPINDGVWMANSTMLGIIGRMVGYSGREITWEEAMNSEIEIGPKYDDYSMDLKWDAGKIPVPGVTKVI